MHLVRSRCVKCEQITCADLCLHLVVVVAVVVVVFDPTRCDGITWKNIDQELKLSFDICVVCKKWLRVWSHSISFSVFPNRNINKFSIGNLFNNSSKMLGIIDYVWTCCALYAHFFLFRFFTFYKYSVLSLIYLIQFSFLSVKSNNSTHKSFSE